MLKFDPQKVNIEIVQLKSVTMALDGSMSIIDPIHSTPKKEVMRRVAVPLSVVRAFIMANKKVTKYLKPVYTAIVVYDGHIVAMERHPLGSMGAIEEKVGGTVRRWRPRCELHWLTIVSQHIKNSHRDWYFDGRYTFSFKTGNTEEAIAFNGVYLTRDGKFRKCVAECFDLQKLPNNSEEVQLKERSCLAFVSSRGVAISPPIWKDLAGVGAKAKSRNAQTDDDDEGAEEEDTAATVTPQNPFNFDEIDATLNVNLNFALKAGVLIGKTFGYEFIEPLQMPRLMVELRTVNLPNVPIQVKATYDIHMKFTHALAWLLGLSRRANTLDTYVMLRALMKYLTKKGVYRSNVFDAARVFKEGMRVDAVKMVPLDTLMQDEDFTEKAKGAIFDTIRDSKRRRKQLKDGHLTVGGFLNEEG